MKNKLIASAYTVLAAAVLAAPVIFATFAVQRLCHVISWSWWLVTSPLWGAALLIISSSVVDLILVSAADFISHRKNRKEAEQ